MKIITLIVTYNALRNNWLSNCIDSLNKSSLKTEILIVDNASTDETVRFIKENYPEIDLIESKENLGFGKGNNLGISKALKDGADYIFLLNQDTIVQENTIARLVEVAQKNHDFAILSPIHLYYTGNELEFHFAEFMKIKETPHFYRDHILNTVKEVYETKFVNAAAWMMPRKTFMEIGGFDPIFRHYAEDDNYCHRVLYHQYKIGVVSGAYIFHDSNQKILPENYEYSEQYYLDYVRHLQRRGADINSDFTNFLKNEEKPLYFNIFYNLLLLRFKGVNANLKKRSLLKKNYKDICESREINKNKGKHYLQD